MFFGDNSSLLLEADTSRRKISNFVYSLLFPTNVLMTNCLAASYVQIEAFMRLKEVWQALGVHGKHQDSPTSHMLLQLIG
jgi:hypothetical protein